MGGFAAFADEAITSTSARHSGSPCDNNRRKDGTLEAIHNMQASKNVGQDANLAFEVGYSESPNPLMISKPARNPHATVFASRHAAPPPRR